MLFLCINYFKSLRLIVNLSASEFDVGCSQAYDAMFPHRVFEGQCVEQGQG